MPDTPRRFWKSAVPLQARKYIHYPFERAVYDYPYDESDFTDVEEKVYIYYTSPEECWEKDGGQYLLDWNKYYGDKWICNWCKFESQKLSDFIPKN